MNKKKTNKKVDKKLTKGQKKEVREEIQNWIIEIVVTILGFIGGASIVAMGIVCALYAFDIESGMFFPVFVGGALQVILGARILAEVLCGDEE